MTSSAKSLLTAESLPNYLRGLGLLKSGIKYEAVELTGGVSNTVLKIDIESKSLIIKQALPQLKVAELWQVDQRRAIVEAQAINYFHKLNPHNVPELIYSDPENFVVIMEEVPKGSSVWKTDLLNGIYEPTVASQLGAILANWHKTGKADPIVEKEFNETSLFEQLRIDPFYRFIAARNSTLQDVIDGAIEELESDLSTVVHGDFSPKNFMVTPTKEVFILDFEVTHLGNPVFDIAFLAAHLLCKFFKAPTEKSAEAISELYFIFAQSYEAINPAPASVPLHSALIALARIEGKSPVDYLTPAQQANLGNHIKKLLKSGNAFEMNDLFEMSAR